MKWARTIFTLGALTACGRAADTANGNSGNGTGGAYDQVIGPILRARCAECHGEQKKKAKLDLHTWEGLNRGSDSGLVFVPGKPKESSLVERMRLPITEDEHMPPGDKPQPTPEEIELIARWIAGGGARETTLASLKLPDTLAKAAAEIPAKLGGNGSGHGSDGPAAASAPVEALWELDAAAVEKARAPLAATVAELQKHFPGALSYESRTSAALNFTAVGFGRDFSDTELALLAPVREQLVVIDVSGTSVTDASAAFLGGCSNLRVFRAGYTKVGDAAAAALAGLPRIESLALSGTAVTAASIPALTKARSLKQLRVVGTPAEQPAQAANLPVAPSAANLVPPLEPEPEKKSQ